MKFSALSYHLNSFIFQIPGPVSVLFLLFSPLLRFNCCIQLRAPLCKIRELCKTHHPSTARCNSLSMPTFELPIRAHRRRIMAHADNKLSAFYAGTFLTPIRDVYRKISSVLRSARYHTAG
jgi:hypothetical protein